jgi:hypothetical protein
VVRVADIWTEAVKIVGNSDRAFLFQRLTDAVELLSIKGDFDPCLGTLDICTNSRVVTLPPEVETILGCNMVGHPAIPRDELFQFHINGPGLFTNSEFNSGIDATEVRYEWMDLSDACTYRELPVPSKLIAYCVDDADVNAEVWIYGLDEHQNIVRTKLADGTYRDGWKIPVFKFLTALPADAPIFSRITKVQKALTSGPIRFSTIGNVLLGVYQSNETVPAYRRIQLSRNVPWVRIRFRRRTFSVQSKWDLLPVNLRQAVIMMLRALKAYDSAGGLAEAEGYEATAVRWMTEKQFTNNPPVVHPIQVLDSSPLMESNDFMQ